MPKKKTFKLTEEEKTTLIDEIGNRTVIWDFTAEDHKKRKSVDDQFKAIATFMSTDDRQFTGNFEIELMNNFYTSGEHLKAEWTSLRNAFNQYKRNAKPKTGDEAGTGYEDITWKFWEPIANFMLSINKFDGEE